MLAPIFRLTLLTFIWSKYKRVIIAGVAMIVALLLINYLHNDFINYSALQEEQRYIGTSFIVKWVVSLAILLAYLIYARHLLKPNKNTPAKTQDNFKITSSPQASNQPEESNDGFDSIRQKEHLLSKADLVIKNKKH